MPQLICKCYKSFSCTGTISALSDKDALICKCYKSFSCTGTISALSDKVAFKYYCISPVNAKTAISSILVYLLGESEKPTKFSSRISGLRVEIGDRDLQNMIEC
jgi:hypothetical protein